MLDDYCTALIAGATDAHFLRLGERRVLEPRAFALGHIPFTVDFLSASEIVSFAARRQAEQQAIRLVPGSAGDGDAERALKTLVAERLVERGAKALGAAHDANLVTAIVSATSRTLFWTVGADEQVRWCCADDGEVSFDGHYEDPRDMGLSTEPRTYRFRRSLTGWLPVIGANGPITDRDLPSNLLDVQLFFGTRCDGLLDDFRAFVLDIESRSAQRLQPSMPARPGNEPIDLAASAVPTPSNWTDSIEEMLRSARGAAARSGASQTIVHKDKAFLLGSQDNARTWIARLMERQEWRCNLTGLPLVPHAQATPEQFPFRPSLDRRCSDGDYAEDNLQVVCQFVNSWKSSRPEDDFLRLLDVARRSPGPLRRDDTT